METLLIANEDKVRPSPGNPVFSPLTPRLCAVPAGLCYCGHGHAHQATDSGVFQENSFCFLETRPRPLVFGFDVWELCLNGMSQRQIEATPVHAGAGQTMPLWLPPVPWLLLRLLAQLESDPRSHVYDAGVSRPGDTQHAVLFACPLVFPRMIPAYREINTSLNTPHPPGTHISLEGHSPASSRRGSRLSVLWFCPRSGSSSWQGSGVCPSSSHSRIAVASESLGLC